MTQSAATDEGWGCPRGATKPHYFIDGRSLCGRWTHFGSIETGRARPGLDCAHCVAAFALHPFTPDPHRFDTREEVRH